MPKQTGLGAPALVTLTVCDNSHQWGASVSHLEDVSDVDILLVAELHLGRNDCPDCSDEKMEQPFRSFMAPQSKESDISNSLKEG